MVNKANQSLVLVFCFLTFSAGTGAQAWDWPQWRGLHRDGKSADFTAPAAWPEQLTSKWKVVVGDGVASPALAGDKLYLFAREGGDEMLRCLDAASGSELWQDKYTAGGATGPASRFSGPRATPTVAEGHVVTLGVRGMLSCLNAETGNVVWRKDDFEGSWPRFFTSSSPIVLGGLCIAQLGGENNGAIVAYDLSSGGEKWKWSGDGAAYASPVLLSIDGADVIIAQTDERIVGLTLAEGQLAWEIPYPVPRRGYNAATPIVDGPIVYYSGSNRGVRAVQFTRRNDELTGRELWSNQDNSVQYNSPILKNGLIYGLSNRDVLFCIDAESGKTAWSEPMGGSGAPRQQARDRQRQGDERRGQRRRRGRGRGGYGSIVDAGSVLFALTPAAQLVVFEPGNKEFRQLASYKVSEGRTFAYPIIDGNRIFVKDDDSVTLWTIE